MKHQKEMEQLEKNQREQLEKLEKFNEQVTAAAQLQRCATTFISLNAALVSQWLRLHIGDWSRSLAAR